MDTVLFILAVILTGNTLRNLMLKCDNYVKAWNKSPFTLLNLTNTQQFQFFSRIKLPMIDEAPKGS